MLFIKFIGSNLKTIWSSVIYTHFGCFLRFHFSWFLPFKSFISRKLFARSLWNLAHTILKPLSKKRSCSFLILIFVLKILSKYFFKGGFLYFTYVFINCAKTNLNLEKPYDRFFSLNTWLQRHGILKKKSSNHLRKIRVINIGPFFKIIWRFCLFMPF